MEPMAGIEPATDGLRNRCSTTELHWLQAEAGYFANGKFHGKLIRFIRQHLGHNDAGGAQQAVAQFVAFAELLDDAAFRCF